MKKAYKDNNVQKTQLFKLEHYAMIANWYEDIPHGTWYRRRRKIIEMHLYIYFVM